MKVYGQSDQDRTAETLLYDLVKDKAVQYVMLNQRKPINARPCQQPGSLKLQAVLEDGAVVEVFQAKLGGEARRTR